MINTKINLDNEFQKAAVDSALNKVAVRKMHKSVALMFLAVTLLLIFIGNRVLSDGNVVLYVLIMLIAGCSLYFGFWGFKRYQRKKTGEAIKGNCDANGDYRTYTIDQDEIHMNSEDHETLYTWTQAESYEYRSHYLFLFMNTREIVPFDTQNMTDEENEQLKEWIEKYNLSEAE